MQFSLLLCLLALAVAAASALGSAAIGADGEAAPSFTLLALCGSLRARSANCALARAAAAASPAVALAARLDLPLYDSDVEAAGFPPAVALLRAQARAAAGFVFCAPEYNAAPSGVFKNAYDWLSRPGPEGASPVKGKPYIVLTAGGSSGGARAQRALQGIVADAGMVDAGAGEAPVAVRLYDGVARFDAASGNLTDAAVLALVAAQVRALEAASLAALQAAARTAAA